MVWLFHPNMHIVFFFYFEWSGHFRSLKDYLATWWIHFRSLVCMWSWHSTSLQTRHIDFLISQLSCTQWNKVYSVWRGGGDKRGGSCTVVELWHTKLLESWLQKQTQQPGAKFYLLNETTAPLFKCNPCCTSLMYMCLYLYTGSSLGLGPNPPFCSESCRANPLFVTLLFQCKVSITSHYPTVNLTQAYYF